MNQLIQTILGISLLAVLVAATTTTTTTIGNLAYASMGEEEGGGGSDESEQQECTTTQATGKLEGWQIETCGNGEQTYISPKGARCVVGEESIYLSCDDMNVMKGIRPSSP